MALTIEDLKHVKEFLYSIRWKWQDLGIELEVDDDNELQAILHKYRDDHGCSLRDLLRLWLNSGKATVGLLKGALKSKAINEPKLAKEVVYKLRPALSDHTIEPTDDYYDEEKDGTPTPGASGNTDLHSAHPRHPGASGTITPSSVAATTDGKKVSSDSMNLAGILSSLPTSTPTPGNTMYGDILSRERPCRPATSKQKPSTSPNGYPSAVSTTSYPKRTSHGTPLRRHLSLSALLDPLQAALPNYPLHSPKLTPSSSHFSSTQGGLSAGKLSTSTPSFSYNRPIDVSTSGVASNLAISSAHVLATPDVLGSPVSTSPRQSQRSQNSSGVPSTAMSPKGSVGSSWQSRGRRKQAGIPVEQQLKNKYREIRRKYSSFVSYLCEVIPVTVTVDELRLFVWNLPALECDHHETVHRLLLGAKEKLKQTSTKYEIFQVLSDHCASFLNFDVFQDILVKFAKNDDSDVLNYSKHLEDYLYEHEISLFLSINHQLPKYGEDSSIELILKFNIDMSYRTTKVLDLKKAIAKILGLDSSALQLVGIKEGCVVLIFLIPEFLFEVVFRVKLTLDQIQKFEGILALWLQCGELGVLFSKDEPTTDQKLKFRARSVKQLQCGQKLFNLEDSSENYGKLFSQGSTLLACFA